ncbi:glycosyltransferase involved in cell wall biosynthesis [Flavobacterium sp. 270]|uniref:glycosyltransferase n=1 Tax=Flavobacterium sp. 270 TaxID=2512114 RepID=UPI0010651EEF|nr:glycosyltransferase [Flavobacterium sp. 270]TDW47166.1 glycosyltransferase involved in cell wall biosynthesis [Flavobacterium sp. 270]
MRLLIVSNAPLIFKDKSPYAYAPYVNELIILKKFSDKIDFCCPVWENDRGLLISKFPFEIHHNFKLIDSNLNSFKQVIRSVFYSFYNVIVLFSAMKNAEHIHLRCPGNIGLIACLVQVLFPGKIKTAKYAGNWDPKSKQPWSYRLQKYILNNTFMTKNMQVLVYGEWPHQSKNIKSFFTATYSESQIENIQEANFSSGLKFIFVGSLVAGKEPLYAIKIVEKLAEKGHNVMLDLYGGGIERISLEKYIQDNKLNKYVVLKGNQNQETIKQAYKESHFVILPSKSEGWPKAIAEGMFWGCVPVSTAVSCVPFMLDYGNRGLLLEMNLEKDTDQIQNLILDKKEYLSKSKLALSWSQKYTTDLFEAEIKKLLLK